MKKNLIYTGTLLMAMTVATGCSNEDGLEQVINQTTVKAVINNETASRTYVDGADVKWTSGDAFTVWNGENKQGNMLLSEGAGTTSGTFAGDVALADGYIALFPAVNDETTTKAFTFPASYDSNETDAPMVGTYSNQTFTFSHLVAMVRVTIENVPAGNLTLTLASNNNEVLTGETTLTESNSVYTLSAPASGETSVSSSTTTTAASTAVFEIPVPAQPYTSGLKVTLKVGETTVLNKSTATFDAGAGQLYKLTASLATAGGNTGIVGQEVTTSEALSTAAQTANATIVINSTEALTLPTTIAEGVTIAGAEGAAIAVSDATILGDNVTIQGLTVSATDEASLGSKKGAFKVTGKNVTIDNCTFDVAGANYDVVLSGENPTLKNCTFETGTSTDSYTKRSLWITSCTGTVTIDNCTFNNGGYPFNTNTNNTNITLVVKNSTLNGWTSFANGVVSATFTDCSFGKSTYAYMRPYRDATFIRCKFADSDNEDDKYLIGCGGENLTYTFTDCVTVKGDTKTALTTSIIDTTEDYMPTVKIGDTTYTYNTTDSKWEESTNSDN